MQIKKQINKFIKTLMDEREIIPIHTIVNEENMLNNKVAVITGGCGGIGFAIAQSFIDSGCKVIITGTNELKLKNTCEFLGENAKCLQLDLNNISTFAQKVDMANKIYGDINIFVHAAGVFSTKNDFLNTDEVEYDSILNTNLKGTYFICQAFAKCMIKNKEKEKQHILIISSQSALEPAWSPYRISKCGVQGITRGIAQQLLPHGIIVNAIGPGPTATKMQGYISGSSISTDSNPASRYAMPEEIATYAKYMVSSLGDMIVGDTLYISGGRGIFDIR
jgi:NAD(P)-dependent dehydrogenase (short-subunit alcohol dehydrogenase family)